MIIDASALVAIVLREPGFEGLEQKIAGAQVTAVGCPTATEAAIVLDARLGAPAGHTKLMRLVHEWAITLVPFGEDHWKQAVVAYARFGRGHHKAALNFADCMSYAVAKLANQPLVCVGDDFAKTDLTLA